MGKATSPRSRFLTLRHILIVLLILGIIALGFLLLGAPIVLRILTFAPRGHVDTYWNKIAQEGTEEINVLPELLSTRPVMQTIVVPTKIATSAPTSYVVVPPTSQPTSEPTLVPPSPELKNVTPTAIETQAVTPISTIPYADIFASAARPGAIRIFSAGYLELVLNGENTFADTLLVGTDRDNRVLGIVEFDETAIPQLCELYFNNCRDPRFRIDKVDFRPKGMLVYGSINIGIFWQQVGVALLLDNDKRHLNVAGIVWNDEIFEVPTFGTFAVMLNDLATRGNTALNNLNILTENYRLEIEEMYFDDDRFIVILRDVST